MPRNAVLVRGMRKNRRFGIIGQANLFILVISVVITFLAGNVPASSEFTAPPPAGLSKPDPAERINVSRNYGRLPLGFEVNRGQAATPVKFLARGRGYTLHLTPTEVILALSKSEDSSPIKALKSQAAKTSRATVKMRILGIETVPKLSGLNKLPGRVNYFIGNNPDKWYADIPTFSRVRYESVYPGIDLIYYGRQGKLEYDFIVSPGADPKVIRLAFDGADQIRLDQKGNLVLLTKAGTILQRRPKVYQDIDGRRRNVSGKYILSSDNEIAFKVAAYDRKYPLIIDPVLEYSTYLGGSYQDRGSSIAVDASGNAYITGSTGPNIDENNTPLGNPWENNFPVSANVFQNATAGYNDVFVTKLNATGTAIIYSTYIGGSANDIGYDIAVDISGNAYVTGETFSMDFPTVNAFQGLMPMESQVAFVTKINPTGSSIIFSTYLGGTPWDWSGGIGIAVDSSGQAYVTGYTYSPDFPTKNPYQGTHGGSYDAFVAKFSITGSDLIFSTYLGGTDLDVGYDIALDSSGDVYVTGYTESSDFPTRSPYQADFKGGPEGDNYDAFVAKLHNTGSTLIYSTYLGGSNRDQGYGITVDSSGNAYVIGHTGSTDFPIANPFQSVLKGDTDAFVTKLNSSGNSLVFSTFLGGSGDDSGGLHGITLNSSGEIYVTGGTSSTDFPLLSPYQVIFGGDRDAFLAKFSGNALVNSTYLGGSGYEGGTAVVVDPQENVYIVGRTNSWDFPTIYPSFQGGYGGGNYDAFVVKLSPGTGIGATSFHDSDYSPANWDISLSELLRAIQIYNIGSYQCDPSGEDGFAPGAGDENCTPHNSDYYPQDWSINLSELLRLIQLYNIGGYHLCQEGEDGYCPGPVTTSEANDRGIWALASGKFSESRDHFKGALEAVGGASPQDADITNFFYAFTSVAAVIFDVASDNTPDNGLETIGDLLDAFDCAQDGRGKLWREDLDDVGYSCGGDSVPITSPTGRELQAWLYEKVGLVLEAGIENLNDVSEDFSLDFRVPYTSHTERFVSDYADVLVLRTFFRMLLASIQIQYAYNLDVDFHFLDNLYLDRSVYTEDILYYYDSLLTRLGEYYSLLDDAKRQLASMSDDAIGAIDLLKNRDYDGGVNYLLDFDSEDFSDSEQMKADLNSFKNSLDSDVEIEIKGLVRSVNLSPFFAGLLDIRDFLPDFVKDEPVEGTMDGSFGGMVDPPLELRRVTWSNAEISITSSVIGGYGGIYVQSGNTFHSSGEADFLSNTGLDEMFSYIPWQIFPDNVYVGRNWQSGASIGGYPVTVISNVASVSETVETVAGVFEDCIKITYTYNYDNYPGDGYQFIQSITRYFKRDVGIVKMIVRRPTQTETVVLTSYTVSGNGPVPLVEGNTWTYQWDKFWSWEQGNTETYTVIWAHVFNTDWELY